jgi:hypothetical protein
MIFLRKPPLGYYIWRMQYTDRYLLALSILLSGFSELKGSEGLAEKSSSAKAMEDLRTWLKGPAADRSPLTHVSFATVPLTRTDAETAAGVLWEDRAAFIRATRADEVKAKVIELDGLKMKWDTLSIEINKLRPLVAGPLVKQYRRHPRFRLQYRPRRLAG